MSTTDAGPHGDKSRQSRLWKLVLGSIGVVYGDIGTSPIYAMREGLHVTGRDGLDRAEVIGLVSLLLWTLILIVTLKYIVLILRADNKGQGGTLSLLALAERAVGRRTGLLLAIGILGTALFFGDAMITPAISVLSAIEGLKLVTPAFEPYVIPITLGILFALFLVQSRGTATVSAAFGPVMTAWFLTLGGLGLYHIGDDPVILTALNPANAATFLATHGAGALPIMAAVFLAVTGAEALYADMGHFGRGPIRIAWLSLVLPSLALAYLGQGALVLSTPSAASDPFFLMAPPWALLPLVILATLAAVIASQAVITGAFSMAYQAVQLGLLPRFQALHTSETEIGQIYMPKINWLLFFCVAALVISFQSSSNLASAYGIAVTGDMIISSVLGAIVFRLNWRWPLWLVIAVVGPMLATELLFMAANLTKVSDGGYATIAVAALIITLMWTWVRGVKIVSDKVRAHSVPLSTLIASVEKSERLCRAPGTAVFLTADGQMAPSALMHNLKHNSVLHEQNYIVSVKVVNQPFVPDDEKISVESLTANFTRAQLTFGYMEQANVPVMLALAKKAGLKFDIMSTSFFLHRRFYRVSERSRMPLWQDRLFIALAANATSASSFYRLPSNRVIELGQQITL
jgi:KUP system potassium uptake protein